MKKALIDIHHHARPAGYSEALASVGIRSVAGRPILEWECQRALDLMDKNGIGTAVLSSPDSESAFAHKHLAVNLSRQINEMYAEISARHKGRFGGFASLPLPHMDESLAELEFAMDHLRLDGVFFSSNHAGLYPGDARLDPLMCELERRNAVVFVHPASPPTTKPEGLDLPGWLIDFPSDTTRCIANLIKGDVPKRFPNVKFIFSHAGGFAPFMPFRFATFGVLGAEKNAVPSFEEATVRVEKALQSFYYDTAQAAHPATLKLLVDLVGPDHILFGSDHPQVPDEIFAATASAVSKFAADVPAAAGCLRDNAVRLLPRFVTEA